ncbi:MAG: dUTP diphosphatase [Candidatus Nanoarchaeia archaeon]|jgi:dUTP pyrophosphatase|nr:dUTP diphosphatase [Candidatus Nanoarchaeia archaeon]
MNLKIKKLYADARLPERANSTDSGADVFIHHFVKKFEVSGLKEMSEGAQNVILSTNDRVLIDTGLAGTAGIGWEIQARPRSGNALNKGLIVVNSPGTIDQQYRGHIGIIIANIGHERQELKVGDKIAQLVVCPVGLFPVIEVEDLDATSRGLGGFGSTGQ